MNLRNLPIVLLLAFSATVFAQTGTIQGTVSDPQNKPIPFVSVSVIKLKAGASSKEDGTFSFLAAAGQHVLQVSSVGFASQQIPVTVENGRTLTLNIVLKESNVGYKRSRLSEEKKQIIKTELLL